MMVTSTKLIYETAKLITTESACSIGLFIAVSILIPDVCVANSSSFTTKRQNSKSKNMLN